MIRWIFTFVLLPASSLLLTRGTSLFSSNFSSIRIALHRNDEFFLWCLICGGFLGSQLALYRPRQAKFCLILLTGAALLPYSPDQLPVCAVFHTFLALAASLLFLYNLFHLTLQLYFLSPQEVLSRPCTDSLCTPCAFNTHRRFCLLLLWCSSVFCLDSWILSGIINSAMEICLTLSAGILFWLLFPFHSAL